PPGYLLVAQEMPPEDAPTPTATPTPTPAPTPVPTPGGEGVLYSVDVLVADAAGNPLRGEAVTASYGTEKILRATDGLGVVTFAIRVVNQPVHFSVTHAALGSRE